MNIHKLLSSKERVSILKYILYKRDIVTVNKTAKELRLSKALISQFFTLLRKEGILTKKNEITNNISVKSLKILLNLSSINPKIFNKSFIQSAGIYGSTVKGENNEESDIDLWILTQNATEEQLAQLTAELQKNVKPLYLTKEKLRALKNKDSVFYYSLVFGSIIIYGDALETV